MFPTGLVGSFCIHCASGPKSRVKQREWQVSCNWRGGFGNRPSTRWGWGVVCPLVEFGGTVGGRNAHPHSSLQYRTPGGTLLVGQGRACLALGAGDAHRRDLGDSDFRASQVEGYYWTTGRPCAPLTVFLAFVSAVPSRFTCGIRRLDLVHLRGRDSNRCLAWAVVLCLGGGADRGDRLLGGGYGPAEPLAVALAADLS